MRTHSRLPPCVGIFWLIGNRVISEGTPLSSAEPYGDCLNHAKSHLDYWLEHQRLGDLPRNVEYEELPRGRVVYNRKTGRYSLCADQCILRRESVIKRIVTALRLPAESTDVLTDSHYRCFRCLEKQFAQEERDGIKRNQIGG
jgi:hypothetical protein